MTPKFTLNLQLFNHCTIPLSKREIDKVCQVLQKCQVISCPLGTLAREISGHVPSVSEMKRWRELQKLLSGI